MKKLIAISVVFALVAGAAFAVDVAGSVIGQVNVLQGTTEKDANDDSKPVTSGGEMVLVRLDGAGETGDGDFGGYLRFDLGHKAYVEAAAPRYDGDDQMGGADFILLNAAWAWWKPIDQFKLIIGSNSDAFWGKEGVTGWSFNQKANDGMATNPGIWCGPYWGSSVYAAGFFANDVPYFAAPLHNRYVFFEGFQYYGLGMEITPADIATINIGIPFISAPRGEKAADQFRAAVFQLDLNFDFGNIAVTYEGANRAGMKAGDAGAIFLYYGGSFGDLSLDVGFSYHLPASKPGDEPSPYDGNDKGLPIGVGVGVKYATDSFGVKFRTTAALAGNEEGNCSDATYINASVLPFFILGDNLAVFVNVGLGMVLPSEGDSFMGWYFNPYLRVGAEWGPTFYAGIKVESPLAASDSIVNWSVPIVVNVSF